jgi:hypothetical protein
MLSVFNTFPTLVRIIICVTSGNAVDTSMPLELQSLANSRIFLEHSKCHNQ